MSVIWSADLSQDRKWKLITRSHPMVHVEQPRPLNWNVRVAQPQWHLIWFPRRPQCQTHRGISTSLILLHHSEMSSSSPCGDRGLELEQLERSACPRADTALTAEKPLQTTGQMCFIWLYLLTHPVCVACEDSITQRHRGQRQRHQTATWTQWGTFSSVLPSYTTVSNIIPHEDTEHLRSAWVYCPRPCFSNFLVKRHEGV